MDIQKFLSRCGNRPFQCDGLSGNEAYMVIEDTVIYIQRCDKEIAEGMRILDMHQFIKRSLSLNEH